MYFKRLSTTAAVLTALAALSACGGSSSNVDLTPESTASSITTKLTTSLAALSSGIGIGTSFVMGLFDENYLDGSVNQASVKASIDAFTAATATTPDLSMFPTAELTNPKVTDCNFNGVCTLTATLTNKDTDDITTVDFSTKVKVIGSSVYLYGDQSSTAL